MTSEHNRGREWRDRVRQDFQTERGRTEGKYLLTSMQVYQDDKLGKLLSRVERLEAALRACMNQCKRWSEMDLCECEPPDACRCGKRQLLADIEAARAALEADDGE